MKILVVSDIHGNLPALESVLSAAVPYDTIWNLGDTVGYGAHPNECLETVEAAGATVKLAGNHDLAAVGLLPIKWFNVFAAQAIGWTTLRLSEANRLEIRSSQSEQRVGQWLLIHGSPQDAASDYIQTLDDAERALRSVEDQYILCGHTHVPMLVEQLPGERPRRVAIELGRPYRLAGRRAVLNPGSIGQPRDGDPRASAMVIDSLERTATWLRVSYDVESAAAAIRSEGLPAALADRLFRGR